MRRFRFSLGTILIIIIILGLNFTALRGLKGVRNSGPFHLMLGILLVSTLLALCRTGSGRAFWIGFALWGWGFLELSLVQLVASRASMCPPPDHVDLQPWQRFLGNLVASLVGGLLFRYIRPDRTGDSASDRQGRGPTNTINRCS